MATSLLANVGHIEVLKLADLNVDDAYQREPKTWLVQDIFNNYDRKAYGYPTVSRRDDGSLWIVDGLQRATAAGWMDMTEIECEVFDGLTRAQEADLRLKKNRRQNETSYERFKAKLAMKDRQALGLVKLANEFGLMIGDKTIPEDLRAHAITSIVSAERVYAFDKGVELRRILHFLQLTFGEVKSVHITSNMMWMMHWIFQIHDKFDEKRMQRVLRLQFGSLKQQGKLYAAQYGGGVWLNMYRALIEHYNDGLPKKAQLTVIMRGARGVSGGPSGASE